MITRVFPTYYNCVIEIVLIRVVLCCVLLSPHYLCVLYTDVCHWRVSIHGWNSGLRKAACPCEG